MGLRDYAAKTISERGNIYCFYGLEGTGKTFTLLTAAREGRGVIGIDTELRMKAKAERLFPDCEDKIIVTEAIQAEKLVQNPTLGGVDAEKSVARVMTIIGEAFKDTEFKNPVVAIDSISQLWSLIQMSGKRRLAKAGKVDMDTFAFRNQMDWGPITQEHDKVMLLLRLLTQKGDDVVVTARAKHMPEYVGTASDIYITAQKDVKFNSDAVVLFRRKEDSKGNMIGDVTAHFEKIGDSAWDVSKIKPIVNPMFSQIREVVTAELVKQGKA